MYRSVLGLKENYFGCECTFLGHLQPAIKSQGLKKGMKSARIV